MCTTHCSVTSLRFISHKYNEIKIIKWCITCPVFSTLKFPFIFFPLVPLKLSLSYICTVKNLRYFVQFHLSHHIRNNILTNGSV